MPMLDVYIPDQALSAEAEKGLLRQLAQIPIEHEGAGGRVVRLADIAGAVLRDPDKGREYAQQRLSARQATLAGSTGG